MGDATLLKSETMPASRFRRMGNQVRGRSFKGDFGAVLRAENVAWLFNIFGPRQDGSPYSGCWPVLQAFLEDYANDCFWRWRTDAGF